MRVHVVRGIFPENAIDMTVVGNDMPLIERGTVSCPEQVVSPFGACGHEASILRAMDERDRDCHSVQVRKIGFAAVGGDDVAAPRHQREMLEYLEIGHAEQLVQAVVQASIELRMLVQQRIQERDAVAYGAVAMLAMRDRIEAQRIVEQPL